MTQPHLSEEQVKQFRNLRFCSCKEITGLSTVKSQVSEKPALPQKVIAPYRNPCYSARVTHTVKLSQYGRIKYPQVADTQHTFQTQSAAMRQTETG